MAEARDYSSFFVPTAEAFKAGHPAYLATSNDNPRQLALVYCQGVKPSESLLHVQWSKAADRVGELPSSGSYVKCHVLFKGTLYAVQGRVVDITDGPMPVIGLKVASSCTGVCLRRSPRYEVLGCVRVSRPWEKHATCEMAFERMNISTVGFGVKLPKTDWALGSVMRFSLKVLAERDGVPVLELPSFELSGKAVLKRRAPASDSNEVHMGFEFCSIPTNQLNGLECWLETCSTYLDEA